MPVLFKNYHWCPVNYLKIMKYALFIELRGFLGILGLLSASGKRR
ncbi:hypothetical protein SAMN03080601_03296 [Alkalitalea saponilacus]|uniref:Uncharacterized protein n=1 Tax=Alkalitalea saponilacus TaxID=889453 RepID=A0A1T5HTI4_9BACT|nr:hypothetical protein SAMN03080601_03296 [Alkalitalea saponilacus]